MTFPRIIHATYPEQLGAGLLILTEGTPIAGHVILYKDWSSMQTALNNKEPVAYSQVVGFLIVIAYAGIIGRGNRLIGDANAINEAQKVMDEMRDWYIKERILKSPARYKRYMI